MALGAVLTTLSISKTASGTEEHFKRNREMAFSPEYRTPRPISAAPTAAVMDAGLRAYMLRVYNWMASGLLLTGVVAYLIAHTSLIDAFYPTVQTPNGLA